MNYNKSIFKKPPQSSKKVFEKKYTIQINTVDLNKRKSEENFKDKINQIPFLHNMSIQNKNMKIPSFIQHNNVSHLEKPLQDQKYYLHILNNIYLNDSHLTNKNIIRNSFKGSSNTSKKFEKKKTFNYIKRGSKDSCQKKNASKKYSYCSKDIKLDNNFRKKSNIINNEVKNNSNKNLLRIKESKTEARNNKSKKDILLRYRSSKTLSKFSNNNDNIINISKNKSSKDLRKHNDDENMIIEEKNEKDIKKKDKEVKKVKNKKKKKNKSVYNVNKQESEIINSETKNNSNKNNSKNIEIIENEINKDLKKYKCKNMTKKLKYCLFCCFNTKEDSL